MKKRETSVIIEQKLQEYKNTHNGKYEVYLSTVTLEEVADCPEPKRSKLRKFLEQINYTVIDITDEMETVAQKIIEMGILTRKSYDDCQHIAAAVVEECNCIIS